VKAILLLAGYATRMYPLTLNTPKALLPVKGKAVIDYIIEEIEKLDAVDEIFAVTNARFFEDFQAWAANAPTSKKITVLNDGTTNNENRLGAIGDIIFTLDAEQIDDDIFVIAGDNLFTFDLREQFEFFRETGCDTVAAKQIHDREALKAFAVAELDENGRVLSLVEKPADPPSDTAIFASYFYKRDTLPLFREYIAAGNAPDAPGYFVQWLHKIRDVHAYTMRGECYDIGTIEMYENIEDKLI
jgi:glucose-1-phosphate thymidylyltransferase